jgi:hypothetical protein
MDSEISESDAQKTTGHNVAETFRQYDQSKRAADRVRRKLNAHINNEAKGEAALEPNADDIDRKLERLANLFVRGLLTQKQYDLAVTKLLEAG